MCFTSSEFSQCKMCGTWLFLSLCEPQVWFRRKCQHPLLRWSHRLLLAKYRPLPRLCVQRRSFGHIAWLFRFLFALIVGVAIDIWSSVLTFIRARKPLLSSRNYTLLSMRSPTHATLLKEIPMINVSITRRRKGVSPYTKLCAVRLRLFNCNCGCSF